MIIPLPPQSFPTPVSHWHFEFSQASVRELQLQPLREEGRQKVPIGKFPRSFFKAGRARMPD
jgi:hypothetical protein